MPMPDRVNDIYPLRHITFNVTNDGLSPTVLFTKDYRNGLVILYTAPVYTDGTHAMVIKNDLSEVIPTERILLPEIVKKASPSFDPLVITSPGGLVDNASGIARLFSVLDLSTDNMVIEITSTGVTVGALLEVLVIAFPLISPTQLNKLL